VTDKNQEEEGFKERRQHSVVIHKIHERLDQGDIRFEGIEKSLAENTAATQRIAENTAGLVRLTDELEAGTKLLCRVALGISFIIEKIVYLTNNVIKPLWAPALMVCVIIYYFIHHQLPPWFYAFFKLFIG
jgi:hypothetical protein